MRTLTKTVYMLNELDEPAKEKARDWYRQFVFSDSSDWDFCFDNAVECAAILGVEIDHRQWVNPHGFKGSEPKIYFSGFCNQGDGASFEGSYRYTKGAAKAIRQHAPQAKTLHGIADRLQEIQRKHFYKLTASITQSGRYNHAYTMRIETEHYDDPYRDLHGADDDIAECMRDFACWIYHQLEREYDYQNSNEAVDESIRCNGYEFTESGTPC